MSLSVLCRLENPQSRHQQANAWWAHFLTDPAQRLLDFIWEQEPKLCGVHAPMLGKEDGHRRWRIPRDWKAFDADGAYFAHTKGRLLDCATSTDTQRSSHRLCGSRHIDLRADPHRRNSKGRPKGIMTLASKSYLYKITLKWDSAKNSYINDYFTVYSVAPQTPIWLITPQCPVTVILADSCWISRYSSAK